MPELHQPRLRDRSPVVSLRNVAKTALALAAAIFVAVSITGGSYALWSDGKTADAGTIAAGSASLSITESLNLSLWSNLTPSESVRQSFTVTNTGAVPMSLQGSATRANSSIEVRLATGVCPGTPLTSTQATVSPTALGTLAVGATTSVCLEVTLAAAAAPGATSSFSVTVDGTQV